MEILFSAVDFRFRVSIYYLWKFQESFNETSEATKRFVDLVSSFFPYSFLSLSLCSRNVTPLYTKWVTWGGEVCVWKRYLRFFFITQIVNAVREGHDKRSPVGQIAAFSPAESVPTTREIEIEARVEANFSSLHRKETINISASCLYIKNSTS